MPTTERSAPKSGYAQRHRVADDNRATVSAARRWMRLEENLMIAAELVLVVSTSLENEGWDGG